MYVVFRFFHEIPIVVNTLIYGTSIVSLKKERHITVLTNECSKIYYAVLIFTVVYNLFCFLLKKYDRESSLLQYFNQKYNIRAYYLPPKETEIKINDRNISY